MDSEAVRLPARTVSPQGRGLPLLFLLLRQPGGVDAASQHHNDLFGASSLLHRLFVSACLLVCQMRQGKLSNLYGITRYSMTRWIFNLYGKNK